jgi:hypothetical protein
LKSLGESADKKTIAVTTLTPGLVIINNLADKIFVIF